MPTSFQRLFACTWVAAIALVLIAALPVDRAYDLVRAGNEAFVRGDFQAALDIYGRAEDSIPDPGLVAFNEGAACYELAGKAGRAGGLHLFHQAEQRFRSCLADATADRRAQALYNLGNALVEQAGTRDVSRLQEAVACYKKCLETVGVEPLLAEDARHNLTIATARLQRAQESQSKTDEDRDNDQNQPPKTEHGSGDGNSETAGSAKIGPTASGVLTASGTAGAAQGANAVPTGETSPGEGHEPPIPDNERLSPMSSAQAHAFIEQAAARIRAERHKHWQQFSSPATRPALDW